MINGKWRKNYNFMFFFLFILIFLQGGRVCYTTSPREGPGVISLRSAGDISVPQQRGPIRRGLIVPQQPPNPPTIIPLKHARFVQKISLLFLQMHNIISIFNLRSHDRESGDYAGSISDLPSVASRLSQVSVSNPIKKILL